MHRTTAALSDGREIIYYDRTARPRAAHQDARGLPAPSRGSEVRRDVTTGDWVVVAGHRQARSFQPSADACPLCPSRDGRLTEIPADEYEVVVFENRYPALSLDAASAAGAGANGGRCEVICFASEHDTTFADLKPEQVQLVLDAWTDRTRELSDLPGVRQVFCFENRGPEMGVTQHHPHGQIYAYPFVTPRTTRMLERATEHRDQHGTNLFEELLAAELADGRRVVAGSHEWVAFVPYAARWPYEVHLYPRRRRRDLTKLDERQREEFAAVYLEVLQCFDRLFATAAPYVSAWHQAPNAVGADELALHLELFSNRRTSDRLKMLGATEVAMDAFSNDITPEEAANHLRRH